MGNLAAGKLPAAPMPDSERGSGLASWRCRRRFALAGWGRCLGGRFLVVWLLDILDPSIGGRPERTLGSESDFLERMVRVVADKP